MREKRGDVESGRLVVVRHGESEFNADGVWTGTADVGLTAKGRDDGRRMGELLSDITFDVVYTSCMRRAVQTRDDIFSAYGPTSAIFKKTAALNERDYGDYTGLNKWQVRDMVGEEAFKVLRRAFDAPIPNGETLRDVAERVVPWYMANVVPQLMAGKNVLIVGHGNSCRALRKYVEDVSDEGIQDMEMDFDKIYVYSVSSDGRMNGAPQIRQLD